jgi:hypothetical protein
MRTCSHCGKLFRSKYENLKLCFDCYKKRDMALEWHDYLMRENQRLGMQLLELRKSRTITPEMAKKLLLLVHPDKHGNSRASNDMTRWVLSQM